MANAAALLLGTVAGLLVWRGLAPRFAAILAFFASAGLNGKVADALEWTSRQIVAVSDYIVGVCFGGLSAPWFPAVVASFIAAGDLRDGQRAGKATLISMILLPTLVQFVPGAIGDSADTAVTALTTSVTSMVSEVFA
jgi:hypothetical protein